VVSEDTGSSVVAMDGLNEQQGADVQLHVIRGWLEDPATVPDGNELHSVGIDLKEMGVRCRNV